MKFESVNINYIVVHVIYNLQKVPVYLVYKCVICVIKLG